MWMNRLMPSVYAFNNKSDSRTLRRLAKMENNIMWQDVYLRNVNMISNMFEWSGMPETVDMEFFELNLLFQPTCAILFDYDFNSYVGLPCIGSGKMNIYYKNTSYHATSLNYSKEFISLTKQNKNVFDIKAHDSEIYPIPQPIKGVVCYDNMTQYPLSHTIEIYTQRIVNAMRAIDVLEKQAQIPSIIETDEESKLAIQSAINDINNNVLAVYVGKDIAKALRESKSLQTQFNPAVLDVMWNHINNLRSEMLTAFGVNNLNTADKKERLITDEVNSNNNFIKLNSGYRLKCREVFCENLKAVFGIDAHVRLKTFDEIVGPQSIGEKNGDYITNTGGDT